MVDTPLPSLLLYFPKGVSGISPDVVCALGSLGDPRISILGLSKEAYPHYYVLVWS